MNTIYSDNSNSEEKEEEEEIYQKASPNDSNTMAFDGNNDSNKESETYNEFISNGNNQINFYHYENRKPKTVIDYLNINNDDYKKSKMYQKTSQMLNNLSSLPKIYQEEICYLSWVYSQKLPNKKLSTIVPIIVYKIITKYNIKNISLMDLKKNINFKYKTYFKNEKLFRELDKKFTPDKNSSKERLNISLYNNLKTQNYCDLVYNSVKKHINVIKEKIYSDFNMIRIKRKKKSKNEIKENPKNNIIIEKIINKLSNEEENKELYCSPVNFELNNCQEQCKSLIYNNQVNNSDNSNINDKIININEENENKLTYNKQFEDYFKNKIAIDILGLGMIKFFIDKNNIIIISYKHLKDIFNYNIYQIKKCIFHIKSYINI